MGLTGFNQARRQAAEKANIPADGMSYEQAIAIINQPLLTETPALETPALEVPPTPEADLPVAPPLPTKTARKSKPKTPA